MPLESLLALQPTAMVNRIIDKILANTPLSSLSPGSATRALVEGITIETVGTNIIALNNIFGSYIPNAVGQNLEFIARMYGLTRRAAVESQVSAQDNVIRFFVANGTFGDINSALPFVIPTGTLITTGENRTFSSSRPLYRTTAPVTVLVGDSTVAVPALSVGTISSQSAPPNTLILHNFFGYTDSNLGLLQVTNDFAILTVPTESDQELRFRIQQERARLAAANFDAVQLAVLSVPGINRTVFELYTDGMGSFTTFIVGDKPFLANSLLNAVRAELDFVTAVGIRSFVEEIRYIGIEAAFEITFELLTTANEKTIAINQVRDAVRSGIAGQPTAELSRGDLERFALAANTKISLAKLTDLSVWRTSALDGTRYSTLMPEETLSIIPKSDQIIITEPIPEPFTVTEV